MYHTLLEQQINKHLKGDKKGCSQLSVFLKELNEVIVAIENDHSTIPPSGKLASMDSLKTDSGKVNLPGNIFSAIFSKYPGPLLVVSFSGSILYRNNPLKDIGYIHQKGQRISYQKFFAGLITELEPEGYIDIQTDKGYFGFYYVKEDSIAGILFYGTNNTEREALQTKSFDNFYRLNNFLESSKDAYYIIYENLKEKNFFSSQWAYFFGSNPTKHKNPLTDRRRDILVESLENYDASFGSLQLSGNVKLQYAVKNRQTNEVFWLEEFVTKHNDPISGDIIISGRITDITKEYMFSLQVKESEERFRLMIEAIPIMVYLTNEDHKIIYTNKATKEFLRLSMEEWNTSYTDYIQLTHPDDQKKTLSAWKNKIKDKEVLDMEYRLRSGRGGYHFFTERAVPRFYENGDFAGYLGVCVDLTKEKHYQAKLTEEKEKLESVYRYSPDIIILIDKYGIVEFVSPSAKRILGFDPSFIENKKLEHFISREFRNGLRTSLLQPGKVLRKGVFEYRMFRQDGSEMWVSTVFSDINVEDKKDQKRLLYSRDISYIKNAELSLMESEQKYRGLFENMQLGIVEVDMEENIRWANNAFEKMTGYKFSSIRGKKTYQFMQPGGDRPIHYLNTENEGSSATYETHLIRKDGQLIDVIISRSSIIDLSGNVKGAIGIHWDVSAIRMMERQLARESLTRQHEILEARLNEEERQKQLLGHELHDNIGQMLTYTSLFLQLAGNAEKPDPSVFHKAQKKIHDTLNEVRRLSHTLVPPALKELGLRGALVEFLHQYSDLNKTRFVLSVKEDILSGIQYEAQIMLYRIIQELTSNTLKHANASRVRVSFTQKNKKLVLRYTDDGEGFEVSKVKKGVGFKSIFTRVNYYQGKININSLKRKGADFVIEFALKNLSGEKESI